MSPAPERAPVLELARYSPDPALTPHQHQVLALLAEGHTLTHAAKVVGLHRNTIRNWRRAVPAFARETEFAVREQALVWHEQSLELAPRAAEVLHDTLHNPDIKPHLRLRAALAVLKIAADPQPRPLIALPTAAAEMEAAHGEVLAWQAGHSMARTALRQGVVHNRENENRAQSCTITPIRRAPEPARNSTCPCGSGQKFKRCCGDPATEYSALPRSTNSPQP